VAGFHNPKETQKLMEQLNKVLPIEMQDSSWHNDACDSVANYKHRIQIFLPNPDEEDMNTFYCQRSQEIDGLAVPKTGKEVETYDEGNEYKSIEDVNEWVLQVIISNSENEGKMREIELEEQLSSALMGWTISNARFMTADEAEAWDWFERGIMLTLTRKVFRSKDRNDFYTESKQVVVQQDPEGNGPGALLIAGKDNQELFGAIR
jgi:hypothetical protein